MNVLNSFLEVVKKWSVIQQEKANELIQNEEDSITKIGYLSLPQFIDDSFEIFLSHEEIVTNAAGYMISGKFALLEGSGSKAKDDQITLKKSKFNTDAAPWKWLARQLFDFIEEREKQNSR
jgi:hypothetical protein